MGQRRIIIVGAGITGLTLGWALKQRFGSGLSLTILEKNQSPGGWIATERGEYLFEKGPRGIRPSGNGVATVALIDALGLQSQVIEAKAKRRYLLQNETLVSPFKFSLLRDLFMPQRTLDEESIYDFASRRFGKNNAERLFDAMTLGVYAGDIKKLSLKNCFPTFYEWEKVYGSLIKGMLFSKKRKSRYSSSLISFKNGMQTLTDALGNQLGPDIAYQREVTGFESRGNEHFVHTKTGESYSADTLIFTTPTPLPGMQEAVATQSLDVVCFGWDSLIPLKNGFGYLAPTKESQKILGAVFDSEVFPQQNSGRQTRVTFMLSKQTGDPIVFAKQALERHLKIHTPPSVTRHFSAPHAIAQYELGFKDKIARIQKKAAGVHCLGSHFNGVAVNDCIQAAFDFAKTLK